MLPSINNVGIMLFSNDNNVVITLLNHQYCNNFVNMSTILILPVLTIRKNVIVASSLRNNIVETMMNNTVGVTMLR